MPKILAPIHPGAILAQDLDDMGLSMNQLAQAIHVPANRISAIVAGKPRSPGKRLCAWPGTLALPRNTG